MALEQLLKNVFHSVTRKATPYLAAGIMALTPVYGCGDDGGAVAGCTTNQDCKGERVCYQSECVDEAPVADVDATNGGDVYDSAETAGPSCPGPCEEEGQKMCYDHTNGYSLCTDLDGDGCFERDDANGVLCGNSPIFFDSYCLDNVGCVEYEDDCGIQGFACNDGECISSNLFCDDSEDCADGSDEKYCGETPCPMIDKGYEIIKDGNCCTESTLESDLFCIVDSFELKTYGLGIMTSNHYSLWIEKSGEIQNVSFSGEVISAINFSDTDSMRGLASTDEGGLYSIHDNGKVLHFDPSDGFIHFTYSHDVSTPTNLASGGGLFTTDPQGNVYELNLGNGTSDLLFDTDCEPGLGGGFVRHPNNGGGNFYLGSCGNNHDKVNSYSGDGKWLDSFILPSKGIASDGSALWFSLGNYFIKVEKDE